MVTVNRPLVIFELANNHFGSLEHGRKIIQEYSVFLEIKVFAFAIKFQYRDLKTLVHETHMTNSDNHYVKRFQDTQLDPDTFLELKNFAQSLGFVTICTPFDEPSVRKILEHNFDYLKIASACLTDWPLIEEIAKHKIPIIASTAGSSILDLRRSVTFLAKRAVDLTLMHCVAKYPTLDSELQLDRIDYLRKSFPDIRIGYSSHENPNNFTAVGIAYAKGARVFEKHVGLESDNFKNNAYSCTPNQISSWLDSLLNAVRMCDFDLEKIDQDEQSSLNSLRRGVFSRSDINPGEVLSLEHVKFAIPPKDGQLLANDWSKQIQWKLGFELKLGDPIMKQSLEKIDGQQRIESIAFNAKNMCEFASVKLTNRTDFEISHHYGLDRFEEFGMVMTTIINRDYCKKILVLFPGQSNPEHYHKIKEETFFCLYGSAEVTVEGETTVLKPGNILTIPVLKKHKIMSAVGVILEELSTTSEPSDSYYTDVSITNNLNRKSSLTLWG
jgi:N-acetylneuraminate synthase